MIYSDQSVKFFTTWKRCKAKPQYSLPSLYSRLIFYSLVKEMMTKSRYKCTNLKSATISYLWHVGRPFEPFAGIVHGRSKS